MGLIRKAVSVSTLGGVKYTSRREAQTKAAAAQAREAREQARLLKAERRALRRNAPAQDIHDTPAQDIHDIPAPDVVQDAPARLTFRQQVAADRAKIQARKLAKQGGK